MSSTTTDRPLTASVRVSTAVRRLGAGVAEIGAATGVSPSTARRRLTGESPFTIPELELVAATFGVSVTEIMRDAEAGGVREALRESTWENFPEVAAALDMGNVEGAAEAFLERVEEARS